MDRVTKFLSRLDRKRRIKLEAILDRLHRHDFAGLDVRKLKDERNLFRVRVGNTRIIYLVVDGRVFIKEIEFRSDTTYHYPKGGIILGDGKRA